MRVICLSHMALLYVLIVEKQFHLIVGERSCFSCGPEVQGEGTALINHKGYNSLLFVTVILTHQAPVVEKPLTACKQLFGWEPTSSVAFVLLKTRRFYALLLTVCCYFTALF